MRHPRQGYIYIYTDMTQLIDHRYNMASTVVVVVVEKVVVVVVIVEVVVVRNTYIHLDIQYI